MAYGKYEGCRNGSRFFGSPPTYLLVLSRIVKHFVLSCCIVHFFHLFRPTLVGFQQFWWCLLEYVPRSQAFSHVPCLKLLTVTKTLTCCVLGLYANFESSWNYKYFTTHNHSSYFFLDGQVHLILLLCVLINILYSLPKVEVFCAQVLFEYQVVIVHF